MSVYDIAIRWPLQVYQPPFVRGKLPDRHCEVVIGLCEAVGCFNRWSLELLRIIIRGVATLFAVLSGASRFSVLHECEIFGINDVIAAHLLCR